MHVDGAVALPREAVTEAQEAARMGAQQPREGFDVGDRYAADGFRPGRCAAGEMGFELLRAVGVLREIVTIGELLAKQHVHDRAGQGAVGARLHTQK